MIKRIRLHKIVFDQVRTYQLDYTRPEVMRNIELFGAIVNGEANFNRLAWVTNMDRISIDHWPIRTHGDFSRISVIHEETDYIVFFKPPGIVIEAGAGHRRDHFIAWLLQQYPEQIKLGDENRFGLVHRLDKDTQGLLLIARTLEAYKYFKSLFKSRTISKKYLAVVNGRLSDPQNIISYNTRDKTNPTRQRGFLSEREAAAYDINYRKAHSNFVPIGYCKEEDKSLVEVTIYTGRMHQIRVHAQLLGIPLVGDDKYSTNIGEKREPNQLKHKALDKDISSSEIFTWNKATFDSIISNLFLPSSFLLLSNYLEFCDQKGNIDAIKYKDVSQIIELCSNPTFGSDPTDRVIDSPDL